MAGLALVIQLAVPFVLAIDVRAHTADPAMHARHAAALVHLRAQIPSGEPEGGKHSHADCSLCILLAVAAGTGFMPETAKLPAPSRSVAAGESLTLAEPLPGATSSYNSRAPPEFG